MIQQYHYWTYIWRNLSPNNKNTYTPIFIAALFTITKLWKQPRYPTTEKWIKTHKMEYYSAIKKNKITLFAAKWMGLEIIMLSEVSQAQKDKGCMFSLIWGRQIQKINV
jgi:hypothetical protein